MAKALNCVAITQEIIDLANSMQGEIPATVAELVGIWQEEKPGRLEQYPTVKQLEYLKNKLREEESKSLFSKEYEKVSQKRSKVHTELDSRTRKDRVNLLAKQFSLVLNDIVKEETENLRDRISTEQNPSNKVALEQELSSLTRQKLIRKVGLQEVLDRIKNTFYQSYLNLDLSSRINTEIEIYDSSEGTAESNVRYRSNEYQKILDNFEVLMEEASSILNITEGIMISAEVEEVITPEERDNNVEKTYNLEEGSSIEDKEETIKEGWQNIYRTQPSRESLSANVRKVLATIPRLSREGYVDEETGEFINYIDADDLGFDKYVSPDYAHVVLQLALTKMEKPSDMLPILRQLTKTNSWVELVIEKLESEEDLFSQFYRNYRKDFVNYGVQKLREANDGTFKRETINVNRSNNISFLINEWRANYEEGVLLDSDSIFDRGGNLVGENAAKALSILSQLRDSLDYRSKIPVPQQMLEEVRFNVLLKLFHMAGISANPDILQDTIVSDFSADVVDNLLTSLSTIFNGIKAGKINEKKDIFNDYAGSYGNIAKALNFVSDEAAEMSFREGDKSYYSFVVPNYLGKTINNLKALNGEERFTNYILNNYKKYDWFYNEEKGEWRNAWLRELEFNPEARETLEHRVILNQNKIEYADWDSLDYANVLLTEFLSDPKGKTARYYVPILSDAQSAEFIRFKRYLDDDLEGTYQEQMLPEFSNLVLQEYDRIKLVIARDKARQAGQNIALIDHYDIVRNPDGTIKDAETRGRYGAEFKFLPALNNYRNEDGTEFITKVHEIAQKGTGAELESYIRSVLLEVLEDGFNQTVREWEEIGLLDVTDSGKFKYITDENNTVFSNRESALDFLRNYYWNSKFATSQIIQLLSTDLAFYKDFTDFQKRFKEVHSPAERINTESTHNGERVGKEFERSIIIADDIRPSQFLKEIDDILTERASRGLMLKVDKDAILSTMKEVNLGDAQAYRSINSIKNILNGIGEWPNEMEQAFNNFQNNTWNPSDFWVVWQAIKPFLYTQVARPSGIEGHSDIKVPVQHKNAEYILLAIYDLVAGPLAGSKLQAINKFMVDNDIDVIQFESTTKVGKQGVVNLNNVHSYDETLRALNTQTKLTDEEGNIIDQFDSNIVQEFPFEDYGIQVATPEHVIDSESLIGTQARKLITSDISDDPNLRINLLGNELTKKEWLKLYHAINTENIFQSFKQVYKDIQTKEQLSELLKREIRTNPRYNIDMLYAVSLNEDGEFNIPLHEPAQRRRIEELLNSILKNTVTKQKIKGGAAIQVSSVGLTEELNIRFSDKDGNLLPEGTKQDDKKAASIAYYEAYMPWYTRQYLAPLMKEGSHVLDITKIPEELRKIIGYRIPTEDKYSMVPIYIKGFLPQQSGGVIMLPYDITAITGSDFDVDKIYLMMPEFKVKKHYDKRSFARDFVRNVVSKKFDEAIPRTAFNNFVEEILTSIDSNTGIPLEVYNEKTGNTDKFDVQKGWKAEKERYRKSDTIEKVKYDMSKPAHEQEGGKEARNNMIIDMFWSILTHPDTAGKMLVPGGFENLKRAANINRLLENLTIEQLNREFGATNKEDFFTKLNKLNNKQIKKLAEKYTKKLDPLSPTTQLALHKQNMTGAALIGIFANHNANHAMIQHTRISVKKEAAYVLNDNKAVAKRSLHEITSGSNYVSRLGAEPLAASVDNVKDPVLDAVNFNTFTSDVAATSLRLGNNHTTVSLFMSQPIVKEISKRYIREARTGKSKREVIMNVIKEYSIKAGVDNKWTPRLNNKFLDKDMAYDIAIRKEIIQANREGYTHPMAPTFYLTQLEVGYNFLKAYKVGDAVSKMTSAMRADTGNGGAGPTFSNTFTKIDKIRDFLEDSKSEEFPLEHVEDLITLDINLEQSDDEIREALLHSELPFMQAFFTLGLESSKFLFGKHFPQFSDSFQEVRRIFKGLSKNGRLNDKIEEMIINDLYAYVSTKIEFFGNELVGEDIVTTKDKRDFFLKSFPAYFNQVKTDNPDIAELEFIKKIRMSRATSKVPFNTLSFKNVGDLSPLQKDRYLNEWASLLYSSNPEARKLGVNLIRYSSYRNGFGFGPNTFIHLSASIAKMAIPGYISMLDNMIGTEDNYTPFVTQFLRNHLNLRQFVPLLKGEEFEKYFLGGEVERLEEFYSYLTLKPNQADPFQEAITTHRDFAYVIGFEKAGAITYYQQVESDIPSDNNDLVLKWKKVTPLGWANHAVEYEYGKPSYEVESIIEVNNGKSIPMDIDSESESYFETGFNYDHSFFTKNGNPVQQGLITKEDMAVAIDWAYEQFYGEPIDNNAPTTDTNLLNYEPADPIDDEGLPLCKSKGGNLIGIL